MGNLLIKILAGATVGLPALLIEGVIYVLREMLFNNDAIRDGVAVVVSSTLRGLAKLTPGQADDAYIERRIAAYRRAHPEDGA